MQEFQKVYPLARYIEVNGWSLDGGPETYTFNIHSPVGKQLALGLSVISDQIGPVQETNAYVDVSYTIPTGMETRLAFRSKRRVYVSRYWDCRDTN